MLRIASQRVHNLTLFVLLFLRRIALKAVHVLKAMSAMKTNAFLVIHVLVITEAMLSIQDIISCKIVIPGERRVYGYTHICIYIFETPTYCDVDFCFSRLSFQ